MTEPSDAPVLIGSGEAEQIAHRRGKLGELRAAGFRFPNSFRRSREADGKEHDSACLIEIYGGRTLEALQAAAIVVQVAGRVVTRRGPFLVVADGSGRMQLYLQKDAPDELQATVDGWDIGDIVAGAGMLRKSRRGDLFVDLQSAWLLTKALRPLPDQYYGLVDHETRYRRRYLDLIMNSDSRRVFETRSRIVDAIRDFLRERGFMEVETPMMHAIPGGATARPFATHHNALDMQLYLRVAPELYLKRLVVGGFERVFEINRNFRNEGLSSKHNPEFTMLEFYQAYADYRDLMDLTEAMLVRVTQQVLGRTSVRFQEAELDFAAPIPRLTVRECLLQRASVAEQAVDDRAALAELAASHGVDAPLAWGVGRLQFALFEALVEPHITAPLFVTGYPIEVSPLARRNDDDPNVTDRFELFVMGREIANGFSELNDAEDQAARFRAQAALKASGDLEAMHFDTDYIHALEYGLPPTAGEGLGVDRLVMLLTDQASIRDVLLFPHMRPRADESG